MAGEECQPLLGQGKNHSHTRHWDWIPKLGERPYAHSARDQVQRFLTSRLGHYSVLSLVALDVGCIFADFLISLYACEESNRHPEAPRGDLNEAQDALGIVSLAFSCLFMTELAASIWAFGLSYLRSWFHLLDATVIIAGFVIDVCLKGVLEEVGSVVVVLRLWRVFKIIEELSAGAEEQMDTLNDRIKSLELENRELKNQLAAIRNRHSDIIE